MNWFINNIVRLVVFVFVDRSIAVVAGAGAAAASGDGGGDDVLPSMDDLDILKVFKRLPEDMDDDTGDDDILRNGYNS